MKKALILIAVATSVFVSGCATIISGTTQTLSFSSEPEGAEVLLDGRSFGVTPLSIRVKKNKFSVVTFKKSGYQSAMIPIDTSYDGVALLSIFWDLSTTDILSGAAWEYSPATYHSILTRSEKSGYGLEGGYFAIKKFALSFGDEIQSELIAGEGETITALIELIRAEGKDATSEELFAIAQSSEHNLDFANKIVEFYEIKQ